MGKLTAAEKKQAAIDKWEKEVLPTIELKVVEFPARVKLQGMVESGVLSTRVVAEAACQGLTGKFIDELEEEDLPLFREYSDSQIMSIGGKVLDRYGNPGTG